LKLCRIHDGAFARSNTSAIRYCTCCHGGKRRRRTPTSQLSGRCRVNLARHRFSPRYEGAAGDSAKYIRGVRYNSWSPVFHGVIAASTTPSATPFVYALGLLACGLDVDQVGFTRHWRSSNAPTGSGSRSSMRRTLECYPTVATNRSLHGRDDLNVRKAFGPAGLRPAVIQDASREIFEFRRELIALAELPGAVALANAKPRLKSFGIFGSEIQGKAAACVGDRVGRTVCGTETIAEARESVVTELHRGDHCLVNFTEPPVAAARRGGPDRTQLLSEDGAGRVDAIGSSQSSRRGTPTLRRSGRSGGRDLRSMQ
jgi:hypothetical protein